MAESITLARPYAKATFESAVADKSLDEWSQTLAVLSVVVAHEKVATLLHSPALTAEQQASTLQEICGEEISGKSANLLRLLAENRRLALLPHIAEMFELLKAEYQKAVEVELTTAFEVSEEIVEQVSKALARRLEREVSLHTRVDRSVIGGAIIRAGDTVIDNSVRGKLKKLAESLNS